MRLTKWAVGAGGLTVAIVVTIVLVRAIDARDRLPDLKPWHRVVPRAEFRAADEHRDGTLERYLTREATVFEEVRRVEDEIDPIDRTPNSRYFRQSRTNPSRFPQDWNRTFEVTPAAVRGGALLLHGLTDSPYSLRPVARILEAQGYYVLSLRVPAHGTVPAALTDIVWEDWAAATRLGARHVRQRIGTGKPFVIVGYSNGGALAVQYAIQAVEDAGLPAPSRLILLSPMIGVSPFAGLARVVSALGDIPYFEKSRWLDVLPEYNPFKYVSFPANAGQQTFRLTRAIQQGLDRVAAAGRLGALPPMLTFLSIVDSTVHTDATLRRLYDRLPANGSAIVVFDMNRQAGIRAFLRAEDEALRTQVFAPRARLYDLTVVTNLSPASSDVLARRIPAGATLGQEQPLGLAWPEQVFSLSHVAIPFPPNDPVYGTERDPAEPYAIDLGRMHPRGEKAVLTVPVEVWMRLTANPFFRYMDGRIREWTVNDD